MESSVPVPGSERARLFGCNCRGRDFNWGPHVFLVDDTCPMHGRPAWEAAASIESALKNARDPRAKAIREGRRLVDVTGR